MSTTAPGPNPPRYRRTSSTIPSPRAGWGDAHHVQPQAHTRPGDVRQSALAQGCPELTVASRSSLEALPKDFRGQLHVEVGCLMPDDAKPPFAQSALGSSLEEPVVGGRNSVNGAAHERALDRLTFHQRFREAGPA